MKLRILTKTAIKSDQGIQTLLPGAVVDVDEAGAQKLVSVSKAELLELEPAPSALPGDLIPEEDFRELYEERAAILEYDGGMIREEAERLALETLPLKSKSSS